MANKSFTIQYLIKARDAFSRNAQRVQKSFSKITKENKKARASFNKTSKSFVSGFARMAVAATAFFSVSGFIKMGARFQDSLADLSAITGASGKDLEKLQGNIFNLGKESASSAADVAEAFKLVASAKPELLENLDALTATTKQVLLLKNAAGIELADAANIASQALNIFGVDADQAGRFVNVLAAGAKLGSSEIADTGEAMLIAGPAARAAGLSFEQLNAAIQTVAKGGIKGTRSGTALNAIFGRLQRSGIDFQKLGLQGSFEVIKKKMDSLTDSTARAKFASKIFGEEHSKVGFALLANVNLLSQYEKSLAGTNIAQEQADIRLGTFNAKARKMGVVIKESLIKAFLRLAPELTKLVSQMEVFFSSITTEDINTFVSAVKIAIETVKILASAFGFVFKILKSIVTVIAEVVAAFATMNFSSFSDGATSAMKKVAKSFGPVRLFTDAVRFFSGDDKAAPKNIVAKDNISTSSRVDVGVNVGLDKGLKQTTPTAVVGNNVRRADIGLAVGG